MASSAQQRNNNTYRRCHSRNQDQHGNILDFLASLDKNKTSSPWQSAVNQINTDWSNMMQFDSTACDEEKCKPNPDKHVTWRENLLDIKTISPRQPKLARPTVLSCCVNPGVSPKQNYKAAHQKQSFPQFSFNTKKLEHQLGLFKLLNSN